VWPNTQPRSLKTQAFVCQNLQQLCQLLLSMFLVLVLSFILLQVVGLFVPKYQFACPLSGFLQVAFSLSFTPTITIAKLLVYLIGVMVPWLMISFTIWRRKLVLFFLKINLNGKSMTSSYVLC